MMFKRNGNFLFAVMAFLTLVFMTAISCAGSSRIYGEAYSSYVYRDYPRAMELLDSIIKQDKSYTQAYLLKSTIYEVQGDIPNAVQSLIAAKLTSNVDETVFFNLGNLYFSQQEFAKAVEEYSQALKINPGFAKALLNRANSCMMQKKYRAALLDYQAFLALTPEGYDNVRKLVMVLGRDLSAVGQ